VRFSANGHKRNNAKPVYSGTHTATFRNAKSTMRNAPRPAAVSLKAKLPLWDSFVF